MQIVHQIFGESLLQALGWTFIHSLWQIGVVAVLLAMARLLMQRSAPRYRYLAGNLALGIICAAAVVTFWLLLDPQIQSAPLENGDSAVFFPAGATDGLPAGAKVDSGSTSNVYFDRFVSYYNQHLPLIVTLWLLGALIFVLRLLGGLALLKSLRHRAVREAGADAQVRLSRIAKQLGVQKPVKLLESSRITHPMVLGHFKPVILLPLGALTGLRPVQLEAVLAHELAHILRQDYLWNLLQSLAEVLFYYHPALWWISEQIRRERENCCDDIAVANCGDPLAYAKALLHLQESARCSPQMALTFAGKKNWLLQRIRRVLNQAPNQPTVMEKFAITSSIMLLALIISAGATLTHFPAPNRVERAAPALSALPAPATAVDPASVEIPLVQERLSLPQVFSPVDTFPRGKTRVTVEHKGQRVRFQIEGGAITSLKIDGKTIPESEFEDYRPLVEEILNELPPVPPTPPAPPAPPALEEVPAPPAPPQPPRFGFGYIHSDSLGANGSRVYQYGLRDFNYDSLRIRGSDVFKLDDSGNVWLFENDSVYRAFPPRSDEWQVFPNIRLRTDGDFQFFPDTFPPGQSYPDSLMRRNEITVRGWWEKGRRNVDSILASAQEKRERIMRELERKLQLQEKEMDRMKEEQEQQIEKFFRQQELRRERKIDLTSRIEKEMMRDGLIESVDKYRLELSADAMKVDGEEQPASIAQKYRDMYERNTGISFQGDTNIVISKSNQD